MKVTAKQRIAITIAMAATAAAILAGCAAETKQDCMANFKGSGLDLKISVVSGSTYRMELCGNSRKTYPAFSVYGAANERDLSDPSILGRYRLSHVLANRSGDFFEVTFSSDLFFIIYADVSPSGSLQYANSNELIRGALSQASLSATLALENPQHSTFHPDNNAH